MRGRELKKVVALLTTTRLVLCHRSPGIVNVTNMAITLSQINRHVDGAALEVMRNGPIAGLSIGFSMGKGQSVVEGYDLPAHLARRLLWVRK